MKLKWVFPFSPIVAIFIADPYVRAPLAMRWLNVCGALVLMTCLLAIIQPWKRDDGYDDRPALRVRRRWRAR